MATLRLRRDSDPAIEITSPRALLGRDKGCDVVVDDPSVSRKHALVERRGEAWVLVDQGSANGTFVDGKREGEAVLRDGQKLSLGTVAFRVEIEADLEATVLLSTPADDENATVLLAIPEAPPPVSSVAVRAPVTVPPVVSPPVTAPPPVLAPPPPSATPPRAAPPPPAASRRPEDEAWDLLGLAPGASPEEIREGYQERARDLQVKLAGARTPGLRTTYEKNVAALERAYRVLAPEAEMEDLARDLPAAQPTVDADQLERSAAAKRPSAEAPELPSEAAPAKGSSALLPPATTVLAFVATGLITLSAFLALSSSKLRTEVKKEEEASDLVAARQAAAKYASAEELLRSGALRNGRLRLCNRSSRSLEIGWLAAISLQKDDLPAGADRALAEQTSGFKVVTYNSGFCGHDFGITLAPGAEQAVEMRSQDPRCRFDGQALFYALSVQRPEEPAPAPAEATAGRAGKKPEAAEKPPGEPGTTWWTSGLLNGRDECVSVGAGW